MEESRTEPGEQGTQADPMREKLEMWKKSRPVSVLRTSSSQPCMQDWMQQEYKENPVKGKSSSARTERRRGKRPALERIPGPPLVSEDARKRTREDTSPLCVAPLLPVMPSQASSHSTHRSRALSTESMVSMPTTSTVDVEVHAIPCTRDVEAQTTGKECAFLEETEMTTRLREENALLQEMLRDLREEMETAERVWEKKRRRHAMGIPRQQSDDTIAHLRELLAQKDEEIARLKKSEDDSQNEDPRTEVEHLRNSLWEGSLLQRVSDDTIKALETRVRGLEMELERRPPMRGDEGIELLAHEELETLSPDPEADDPNSLPETKTKEEEEDTTGSAHRYREERHALRFANEVLVQQMAQMRRKFARHIEALKSELRKKCQEVVAVTRDLQETEARVAETHKQYVHHLQQAVNHNRDLRAQAHLVAEKTLRERLLEKEIQCLKEEMVQQQATHTSRSKLRLDVIWEEGEGEEGGEEEEGRGTAADT